MLHNTQVDYTINFLDEMNKGYQYGRSSGMLLSGPKGSGKTFTGILTDNACKALNKLVIYVQNANEWVYRAEEGLGDEFLLSEFFEQNADIIMGHKALKILLFDAA